MKAKRYKTQVYIDLRTPDVIEESGGHRVALMRSIRLDFVPSPGLFLRFEGNYPEQETHHWSPLMKVACGPHGAFGRGFNIEIWPLDTVIYDVAKKRFEVNSSPEMLTLEQLNAVEELMCRYHGFRLLYPHPRSRRQSL